MDVLINNFDSQTPQRQQLIADFIQQLTISQTRTHNGSTELALKQKEVTDMIHSFAPQIF